MERAAGHALRILRRAGADVGRIRDRSRDGRRNDDGCKREQRQRQASHRRPVSPVGRAHRRASRPRPADGRRPAGAGSPQT